MKKTKSRAQKSVTFDVKRTLNDSLFLFIHTDRVHYSPGDVISGSVFMNLLEPVPTDAVILCINGIEEVHFTLMANTEDKEHNYSGKIFEMKQNLYKSMNGSLPKGDLNFPFEIVLPLDLPSSGHFSDESSNGGIKYEISIHLISIDRRSLENIHLKKMIDIINPEKFERIEGYGKGARCETNFESLKENLLLNDKEKIFECDFALNRLCCFGNQELNSKITIESDGVVGKNFEISHSILGEGISYATYRLVKEIKMVDEENRTYTCKKTIEEQEVRLSRINNSQIKIVFWNQEFGSFPKSTMETSKIIKCPSTEGKHFSCKFFINVEMDSDSIFGSSFNQKVQIYLHGDKSAPEKGDIQNLLFEKDENCKIFEKVRMDPPLEFSNKFPS